MFGKEKRQVDFELFTIYDAKTESYREPISAINRHSLIRDFTTMMQDPVQIKSNPYYTNAEDFAIFKIGDYCKKTGSIDVSKMEHVCNLHELKASLVKKQPQLEAVGTQHT